MWIHDAVIWTQDDAIAVKDAFRCPPGSEDPENRTYQVELGVKVRVRVRVRVRIRVRVRVRVKL